MNLSKFISRMETLMTKKISRSCKIALFDNLNVNTFPVQAKDGKNQIRIDSVRQIISSMVSELHRRGRPKKSDETEKNYAA